MAFGEMSERTHFLRMLMYFSILVSITGVFLRLVLQSKEKHSCQVFYHGR